MEEVGRYRTFWPRLRASIVDLLVLGAMLVPVTSALDRIGTPAGDVISYLVGSSVYLIYSILFHAYAGQTIGKYFNNIRVISADNGPLTMRQAILRDSPVFLPLLYQISVDIPYVLRGESSNPQVLSEVEQVIYLVAMATSLLWAFAEIASMLTNPKRRAIHDFIAGSVVIRLRGEDETPRASRAQAKFAIVSMGLTPLTFSILYLFRLFRISCGSDDP